MTDFTGLPDADVLRLLRLRKLDIVLFTSELARCRAAAETARIASEQRQRVSDERNARRQLETTAPGLSAEDHLAIREVMLARKCDQFQAAVIVGEQRAAEKAQR